MILPAFLKNITVLYKVTEYKIRARVFATISEPDIVDITQSPPDIGP